VNDIFSKIASKASDIVGSPWAFIVATTIIIAWALSGPVFGFSDTWQLIINTSTTIVTFLMVFLIQNTQNRSDKATQIKLDELLRATKGARNSLVDIEEVSDKQLKELQLHFRLMHEKYGKELEKRNKKKRT
jgi:low affinity Fe/Cu permease